MEAGLGLPAAAQAAAPAVWERYFTDAPADAADQRLLLVRELARFFAGREGWSMLAGVRRVNGVWRLALDMEALERQAGSEDLAAALQHQPQQGLACLAAAAHEVCLQMSWSGHRGVALYGNQAAV